MAVHHDVLFKYTESAPMRVNGVGNVYNWCSNIYIYIYTVN